MKNLLSTGEKKYLNSRKKIGIIWQMIFFISMGFAVLFLCLLILTIINNSFGSVIVIYKNNLKSLGINKKAEELSKKELIEILYKQSETDADFTLYALKNLENQKPFSERSRSDIYEIFFQNILTPSIEKTYSLAQSVFSKKEVMNKFEEVKKENTNAEIHFRSWVNIDFVKNKQSSDPLLAGLRTAILGSLWIILIVIVFALPLGIMSAVYLEEYAKDNLFNRIIQVNIYNLAGVPSIIYGLLGLSIFVRALSPITSGAFLSGINDATVNGRTILSAGLTLSILVLPLIIINSQEAIKAVSQSLRESSYGLGATKLQTIIHHVLPASFDRIMTGTILAVSRAIGETAPIVVVGASTFIVFDPATVFSKFTTLPIQIYQWTSRPQEEFKSIAAAAILVLLLLLLTLNSVAIFLRDYNTRKRRV